MDYMHEPEQPFPTAWDTIEAYIFYERLEWLEEKEGMHEEYPDKPDLDEDEKEELEDLKRAEGYIYDRSQTLINDDYFQTFAQEYAEEIGAIPDTYHWPTSCIDWEMAAKDLQADYTAVEIDGVTF